MKKTQLLQFRSNPFSFITKRWFVLLVVVLLAIALVSKFVKQPVDKPRPKNAVALTITSARATKATWPNYIEASGPIAAKQEAIIGSEISGQRLITVNVNVGDMVKKGQVLAAFNKDLLEAQKIELEANWRQADADRKRAEKLKKSGTMSRQLIDSYVSKAAIAKARLDAKDLELRYTKVIAPEDGVISARQATLGAIGNPGVELFRMIVRNENEWRGELTAEQVAKIKVGQTVELILPDGSQAHAVVRQISPAFNTKSRLATVYADIKPGSHAHAGMYADGKIKLGSNSVVNVPANSVVIRDGYSYIFKLVKKDNDTTVTQHRVKTGALLGNRIEITEGVRAGDQIASQGAGFLNDGDHIRLATISGSTA